MKLIVDTGSTKNLSIFLAAEGKKNNTNAFIQTIIPQSFDDFFSNQIDKLLEFEKLPLSFCGSVAFHFLGNLENHINKRYLNCNKMIAFPKDRLVTYHLQNE